MPKVDLETVKMILQRNDIEDRRVTTIVNQLNAELEAQKEERQSEPPVKKQFCVLLADPKGELHNHDLAGWVVQIPEEDSPHTAAERMQRGAYDYNTTKKGRRIPVKTLGEAAEVVSARHFKEHQIWLKTKQPVHILPVSNTLPKEASSAQLEKSADKTLP